MTTGFFHSIGEAAVRSRRRVLGLWLVVVVAAGLQVPRLFRAFDTVPYHLDGSESALAADAFARGFPQAGSEQALLVVHAAYLTAGDAAYEEAVRATIAALEHQAGVVSVLPLPAPVDAGVEAPASPLALLPVDGVYSDPHNRYAVVGLVGDDTQRQRRVPAQRQAADRAAREASAGRVGAFLVGPATFSYDLRETELGALHRIELISVPLVLVALLIGFRRSRFAVFPLAVAGVAICVTCGLFGALSSTGGLDATVLLFTSVLGLVIGVDYAVFVVFRYREALAEGKGAVAAGGIATATAGVTIACSGLVVAATAPVLFVVRSSIAHELALALVAVVAVALAAALTLLPALLSMATPRAQRLPSAGPSADIPGGVTGGATGDGTGGDRKTLEAGRLWRRWVDHLMGHPWPYLAISAGLLLLCASPVLGMRLGLDFGRQDIAGTDTGRGLAIAERDFPGGAGLITILLPRPSGDASPDLVPLLTALRAQPEFATGIALDNGRDLTAVLAIPRQPSDSPATVALVRQIRDDIAPSSFPKGQRVFVGGLSALLLDIVDEVKGKLWLVITLVLAVSFGCLLLTFRSPLLALKAIAVNLLGVGAALGGVVVVFQWGLGESVFHFAAVGTTQVYLPVVVFVILFAVSTDYEVFLIRHIQEDYHATGDTASATSTGLQRSARSITLAAAITASAFGGLMFAQVLELKAIGFALTFAIVLDATIVRLVIVPASMCILGRWNWWMPSFRSRTPDPLPAVASGTEPATR